MIGHQIRVGDHVRIDGPSYDANVVWEVSRVTRKTYHLRCDVVQNGETHIKRLRARKEDCSLVATQHHLTEVVHSGPRRTGAGAGGAA